MRKLILFALTAGAATMAIAADPAPQGQWSHGAGHGGWARPDFAKMRAQRADDIALLIGLRPDQRPALDALLASMEPQHRGWGNEGGQQGAPPSAAAEGTLAKLDKMSARIDRRNAEAKQHIEAARKFYTSLNPDQQRRFDALERLRRMHDHEGMRGGHGHHGPEGGPPPPPQG